MKAYFKLEKFAFIDETGLIYTSLGPQTDIVDYNIDYRNLSEPEIHVKDIENTEKKVIIVVPIKPIAFCGQKLIVCFMEKGDSSATNKYAYHCTYGKCIR